MLQLLRKVIVLFFSCFLILSCSHRKNKIYTIGFSQCVGDDLWRKQMINEMKIEASFYDNINLIIEDAKGNSDLQVNQIQNLLDRKVDLLIISPNESKPITPIAEKAYLNGTPTVLIDRKIDSDKYSVFIGADNYAIGKYGAMFLGNLTKKKLNILEIWGLEGSSPARERHKGFVDQLKLYPNLNITGRVQGQWLKQEANRQVMNLTNPDQFDIIFGHNEEMAKGAFEAYVDRKIITDKKIFLGVDALQGKDGGIQAVIDKKLTATLLYPTGGGKAIQVAIQILEGKSFNKEYILNTALVDSSNAQILQLQSDQINDYLGKIEKQLSKISILDTKYNNQQTLFYISVILIILAIFFIIMLYFFYSHTKRILYKLKMKNEEIIQQREELQQQKEQLVVMNHKIEDITALKLRFFTNVSHELRTPLSLLISPLEKILETNKNVEIKRELIVMKNNINRLLRLIGQLLDFRKIEDGQMKLYVSKINIVNLVKNVKAAFNYQAHIKEIEYLMVISNDIVDVYCDLDKIEKALLNLLSNAFKFSKKTDKIQITLSEDKDEVFITISDSGKGMNEETLQKLFERFYQGKGDYSSGTGIGLNLSKEYIELHKGRIEVESKVGEGSSFTIVLRKGREHLNSPNIEFISDSQSKQEMVFNQETEVKDLTEHEPREYSILIVEDDDDMREYLRDSLRINYSIYTATNGSEAFQVLKAVDINLIVCDVMMPEMDGFEFCNLLKNDLAYSHIPAIMLTALAGEDQLIKGLTAGADDYLSKPFNSKHLELKIKNLLSLRKNSVNLSDTSF